MWAGQQGAVLDPAAQRAALPARDRAGRLRPLPTPQATALLVHFTPGPLCPRAPARDPSPQALGPPCRALAAAPTVTWARAPALVGSSPSGNLLAPPPGTPPDSTPLIRRKLPSYHFLPSYLPPPYPRSPRSSRYHLPPLTHIPLLFLPFPPLPISCPRRQVPLSQVLALPPLRGVDAPAVRRIVRRCGAPVCLLSRSRSRTGGVGPRAAVCAAPPAALSVGVGPRSLGQLRS